MAVSLAHLGRPRARRKPRVLDGYRRLLVPVSDNPESEEAIDVASRLAAEHGSSMTIVTVVEVPPVLPVDAHMREEEARAHALLRRAAAVAETYGVTVSLETLRGRDAASAIVREAISRKIELLVVGAPRRASSTRSVAIFGHTVEHVLKHAPCRVMIVGAGLRRQSAA
jgi:nucleotide-binding universal stress UspA family protein